MRIALFGGSFDPPHRGHLSIATAAADTFHLDTVLFAPTGRQPLKPGQTPAPFADRLAMTALLCAPDQRFHVSPIDAPRADGQPNYTVDTLAELKRTMPDATLFNIVGADSFLDLPRWREPQRLLELAEWIVVSRPGFSLDDLSPLHVTAVEQSRVHLLQNVHEDISATDLRRHLRNGETGGDLIPAAVSDYIRTHHLYR